MRPAPSLVHEFVKAIPEELEERTLYVSMDYAIVAHKCCCGCGGEVVTPLSPIDWKLTYNGKSISLSPSIGNWSFECMSHYWIEESTIKWAGQWSKEQIEAGRRRDRELRDTGIPARDKPRRSFWSWLSRL